MIIFFSRQNVRLGCREKSQVGVGGFGAGEKGDEEAGPVKNFDRGGKEDGQPRRGGGLRGRYQGESETRQSRAGNRQRQERLCGERTVRR